ncbi:2-octaprenyl-6-methoxyphenyl hydroxylase [Aestuariicella hydrocarbonica]|uniref:2-octaprenyl-6-methoxyphenyl hydroxylase n=2 Tax=Pseudomaricurvus hydrocarbonicus TaxID=1470433 RepID=A0A9E5MNV8_9GAMM|nr:2-octaprenyl-6-methoxyphenyl hydroxylase [Aestuariicella hydrocarbonica]
MQSDSGLPAGKVASTDIAIVGGGMVGAALAALLAHAEPDWSITLLEAFPLPDDHAPAYQPSYDDRSTAIAHGSVLLLQQVGVWAQLREYATAIEQVHVSDKGHLGGTLIDRHQVGVDALGYVIPNAWIGRVLIQHLRTLPNVTLVSPAHVRQLKPVADGAELIVEMAGQQSVVHTQLAVIADGAQSALRASLGIDVDRKDYQQTAIVTNISLSQPHQGVAYERFTDEGPMAMLPLGGSVEGCTSALVWTQPKALADEVLALSDEAFLSRLQQRFGFRLGPLTGVGKRDSYALQLSVAKEQVRSSVVVMGNAAHFLHPVAGQGFNLALRDCAALAATLKPAGDRPLGQLALLQQYLKQQALDQQATIHFSDQLTRLFSSSGLPQAALRGLGFVGLECVPPAKQWLAMQTMGNASRQVVL